MFGDASWRSDREQTSAYYAWQSSVKRAMKKDTKAKMVIIEIGAGIRVSIFY